MRRIDGTLGSPNAFALYGIADDSSQRPDDSRLRRSPRSRSGPTAGRARCASASIGPGLALRQPDRRAVSAFDPFGFGANYLGNTVTIAAPTATASPAARSSTSAAPIRQPFDAAPRAARSIGQTQSSA